MILAIHSTAWLWFIVTLHFSFLYADGPRADSWLDCAMRLFLQASILYLKLERLVGGTAPRLFGSLHDDTR
jgi:hypothetical protein